MSDTARWAGPGPPQNRQQPQSAGGRGDGANLADILERVLDKGIVIAGDIQVNLLDIELLTIKIRLVVASVERAKEMGIDWWERDPTLSAGRRELEDENRELRARVEALERGRNGELPAGSGGRDEYPDGGRVEDDHEDDDHEDDDHEADDEDPGDEIVDHEHADEERADQEPADDEPDDDVDAPSSRRRSARTGRSGERRGTGDRGAARAGDGAGRNAAPPENGRRAAAARRPGSRRR